jgi:hypothetical protein
MIALLLNDPCTRVRTGALAAFDIRPDTATPHVIATLRRFEGKLAARQTLSKPERAFLRGLRSALRRHG